MAKSTAATTAQQAWEQSDLALKQQQEALEKAYKRQLEESQKAYELAGSQSERNMLAKGMQRSSYGAATLGNIKIEGAEAASDIASARTTGLGDIAEQRALLKRQLSGDLAQIETERAWNIAMLTLQAGAMPSSATLAAAGISAADAKAIVDASKPAASPAAASRNRSSNNNKTNPPGFTPLWQTQGFKSYADAQKARAKGLSAQQYYADSGPIIDTVAY